MTREEKALIIDDLAKKFGDFKHFYITDATGMSVANVNDFRRMCYNSGIEYGVYKNTLIRKALEKQPDGDYSPLFEALKGFSGILFSKEVANAPGKVMRDIRLKLGGKPVLKAASIDTDFYIGDEMLETLADLKSKEELIGEVIALLQSPMKNVISALSSGENKVAGLVEALEKRAK
jgi:large subunit ribosomal protein L10